MTDSTKPRSKRRASSSSNLASSRENRCRCASLTATASSTGRPRRPRLRRRRSAAWCCAKVTARRWKRSMWSSTPASLQPRPTRKASSNCPPFLSASTRCTFVARRSRPRTRPSSSPRANGWRRPITSSRASATRPRCARRKRCRRSSSRRCRRRRSGASPARRAIL